MIGTQIDNIENKATEYYARLWTHRLQKFLVSSGLIWTAHFIFCVILTDSEALCSNSCDQNMSIASTTAMHRWIIIEVIPVNKFDNELNCLHQQGKFFCG